MFILLLISHILREVIVLTRVFFIAHILISFFIQAGGPISKMHPVFDDALHPEVVGPFGLVCSSLLDLSFSLLRFILEAEGFSCSF